MRLAWRFHDFRLRVITTSIPLANVQVDKCNVSKRFYTPTADTGTAPWMADGGPRGGGGPTAGAIAHATSPPTPRFVTNVPTPAMEKFTLLGKARTTLLDRVKGHEDLSKFMQSFFDSTLAVAIQERETKYVNTMTDVFKGEIKDRQETVHRLTAKCTQLETRMAESDQVTTVLHSKLDRRTYEMDMLRKMHFKELLMLREMVAKHRTDPRTLKALDGTK
ncbi:Aste57867_13443 [Aphanomyces stellatus]|uniref:Aste57867_13443 protein n=1 Tax=Aphanomyces stellatus TaxID=120398 RepID=A0A485KZ11_9STRA|nr:hypothetical protein As57867_013393 [Aphanomyces stellatus]VFT90281.1 Aste57867_13443 [Aphanomyces stellatus]